MDYEQLVTFDSLVKTKNFTRTAESLNIVQSTVTTRIKMLETELGESLFYRKTRNVELTAEGKVFHEYAEGILRMMAEGTEAVRIKKTFTRRLVFSAVGSVWEGPLFEAVNSIKDELTAVRMITDHSQSIIRQVSEGSVDIGFIYTLPVSPQLEVKVLYEDSLVLVSTEKKDTITSQQLLNHHYVHYNWGTDFMEWFESEIGNEERVSVRVDSIHLAVRFLNNSGIGFLPRRVAEEYIRQGKLFNTIFYSGKPIPERKVYMIFKKSKTEELSGVIQAITAAV